jgi:RimJ/RimL family protein N-acetyltransferase
MPPQPPGRLVVADGVVLRRESLADATQVAATVRRNLDHLRPWMPWATAENASDAAQRRRAAQVTESWDAGTDFNYVLIAEDLSAHQPALLGVFGLHRRIGPGAIELGYWLSQEATGHGYATKAAEVLTRAALALPDVDRVEIRCDVANVRSQKIPGRLGYRLDRIEADQVEAPAEIGQSMIWIYPPQ